MALCPFHPDTTPSCSIHLERKVFYCFGCGAKGSVLDFVARIEHVSIHDAAARIKEIADTARRRCRGTEANKTATPRFRSAAPASAVSAYARPVAPLPGSKRHWSRARRNVGLGYCSHGTMQGRICIPIHDERGVLVASTGRWASDELPEGVPKYDLPRHFPKRRVLFNLHRVAAAEHLVLVKGYWSVFRLYGLGVSAAVSHGATLSVEQEALLVKSGARMLTLILDGDRPGREATDELVRGSPNAFRACGPAAGSSEAGHGA